jgi:hypothetical protein
MKNHSNTGSTPTSLGSTHYFGSHKKCGTWSRVKLLAGEERKISDLRYRNKETPQGLKFYLDVRDIVVDFAEQSADMLHGWSSDIVEGRNKFFTKFLPKDRTYAMIIENQVRIHLANFYRQCWIPRNLLQTCRGDRTLTWVH